MIIVDIGQGMVNKLIGMILAKRAVDFVIFLKLINWKLSYLHRQLTDSTVIYTNARDVVVSKIRFLYGAIQDLV